MSEAIGNVILCILLSMMVGAVVYVAVWTPKKWK